MLELHLKKLPFDFEHFVHIPLSNLDNYILFTNPENMIPPPKRKEIKNKRIEQNNENDLYNLTDISAIKKKEDSSSQRQNSPNKKNIGPNKKNSPSSPKFNFKSKFSKIFYIIKKSL